MAFAMRSVGFTLDGILVSASASTMPWSGLRESGLLPVDIQDIQRAGIAGFTILEYSA